jgi:hypothetical protein
MSGPDLTRWNRAGLSRFRYVDGNAVTFLEDLRLALEDRFAEWGDLGVQVPADERPLVTLARILEQYEAAPGDMGWEIARTLARGSHVLSEHLDAYANESYLGTATQWDNVRKLVEMLDYSPAPPASASTSLVLTAKPEAAGTVDKGVQVKHTPEDGGAPVVFETLADIEVDAKLNELRLEAWNRSPRRLTGSRLTLAGALDKLEAGTPLVLEDERSGRLEGRLIASVRVGETSTVVDLLPPALDGAGLRAGWTRVHVEPAETLDPIGPASKGAEIERGLYLEAPPRGLRPGEVVFIGDGVNSYYRRVTAVEGRRIVLDEKLGQLSLDGAFVSRARTVSVSSQVQESRPVLVLRLVGDLSALDRQTVADLKTAGGTTRLAQIEVTAARYQPVDPEVPESGFTTVTLSDPASELVNPQSLYIPPLVEEFRVDSYLQPAPKNPLPLALVTESPKKIGAGDLAVVTSGRMMAWARLDAVTVDADADTGTLSVSRWRHRSGGPYFVHGSVVHGHFKQIVRVTDWQDNRERVVGDVLPLETIPATLAAGRGLLVSRRVDGVDGDWLAVEVLEVRAQPRAIVISPGLPRRPRFTRGNTVLHGNVVAAGHGERRPQVVLASGDATQSNRSYVLAKEGVSFIADPTQPSGVRADIEVTIGGRTWEQVPTLRTSDPADAHYTVRMTEDGHLRVGFGDGRNGRRLPSGSNNVRVGYRVGNGLAGNVAAGSLSKLARPHRLLDGVTQPLAATGGNDMESIDSMRDNAPASVLTLERAVSLADFGNLAARQSSVWQAVAFSLPTTAGRHDSVEVVVVPAGGGQLGDLGLSLKQFLEAHALPGVEVAVRRYEAGRLSLQVTLRVQSEAFDPAKVRDDVEAALLDAFSLSRRGLGQDLFLSEVFQVVEGVQGVENSTCVIDGDPELRRRRAARGEVIFLSADGAGLRVDKPEEFEL